MTREIKGWLFDIDEIGSEIALWVYTDQGRLVRLTEKLNLPVYATGEPVKLKAMAYNLQSRGIISGARWVERTEFWTGGAIPALELSVADSAVLSKLRRAAASHDRDFLFYNCDIPASQYYLYLKGLFPFCRIVCAVDGSNLVAVSAEDSVWEIDYAAPQLRVLKMRGERMRPVGDRSRVILEYAGKGAALRMSDGQRAIQTLNRVLDSYNPDLILSEHGDTILMPALLKLAAESRMELRLDRERIVVKRKILTEGRSYFTYGRIVYRGPSYPLFGRWHIDQNNSFIHRETEMEGLVELARLAKIPVQRMARTTPGSAMSSMEMDRAVQEGILVPWHKSEPESYKTALDLLTIDKGGLVYQPPVAAIERVAEIDFSSMYPSIMVNHNISPETVLCHCCQNQIVPEAGYNVCERRRGLISKTLEPLLARRKRYKQLIRSHADSVARDRYDSRQTAIKWMLVSCFGYLGYKNARFGRIEAHEAVTAFGRDKLLEAKEIAEAAGFPVLHAITDSLWVKLKGEGEPELLSLCRQIGESTGIDMSLEGVYDWIVFLPSKMNEKRPVASRYYGVFTDGKMKLRGLACRRSDTPNFIKEVQLELLGILGCALTLDERDELMEHAEVALDARIAELESGKVNPTRLLLKSTLTKEIDDYVANTRTLLAARQLRQAGVAVHPGQSVRYVIRDSKSKDHAARVGAEEVVEDCSYDASEYVKLLRAAADEVLWPRRHCYRT
jgi:DNA polymerase-2